MSTTELPDIGEVFARVLERVSAEHQPLLIALAERLAAERYRGWADEYGNEAERSQLRACADREEEIAGRIEALFPDAAAIQREILDKNADIADINRTVFAGRPITQQFAMQAAGERLGAATWRSLAKRETSSSNRGVLSSCAELEEASARVLEAILESDG